MMTPVNIRAYYRSHDHFRRYSMSNQQRVKELSRLYSQNKVFFGKKVLDLACGAGILGFIVERDGHDYLGLDKDPDMLRATKEYGKQNNSKTRFLLGDARRRKISGKFDTVTLLGNAVIHFDALGLSRILQNVSRNVRAGTHFIVEYRDVVSMLYSGDWSTKKILRERDMVPGKVIGSQSIGADTISGNIKIQSFVNGRKSLIFTHAIWSPFIIQAVMQAYDYRLVKREQRNGNIWLDVYRVVRHPKVED